MIKRFFIFFLIGVSFTIGNFVNAETFPLFSQTITYEQVGATVGDVELLPAQATGIVILNVHMVQSDTASNTGIKCGTQAIAKNYARETVDVYMAYRCFGNISINKTGNDISFSQITYRPYYTAEPITPVVIVSGDVSVPVFEFWLGLASFFCIFFAVIFYFKRNKSVLVNKVK
jgi:hypothetical protein